MLPKPVMKSLRIPVAQLALALALVIPGLSIASPPAWVEGYMETSEGYSYLDPGATSATTAVSITHSFSDGVLSYTASAGGGSISGGANPFIAISTYASNNGAFQTRSGAHAGTLSSFYVGTIPGFDPPAEKMSVPVKAHYTSILREQFGTIPASWNRNEDGVQFNFGFVNWRPYNQDGYLSGNFNYGEVSSVGLYSSLESDTRNDGASGAWASADLSASITPYVDPEWNAAHGNGYKVYYVGQVPEPETYGMMMAGLGLIGFLSRRRKLNA